ncbi:unnamed protein product [Clonostachys solani]|uniref:CHAT domain-containing protein n=1 Tax=Clonostachys solani TaxID=160281 RepID=A0A9P0EL91_9HYPO|nr:unnamed protein product [Clonostachys solani]
MAEAKCTKSPAAECLPLQSVVDQIDELVNQASKKSIDDLEVNELDQILQLADSISNYRGEDGADPDPLLRSSQRANALFARYRKTSDEKNLEESLSWFQILLREPPEDEDARISLLYTYSVVLGESYVLTQNATHLHESIKCLQEVIDYRYGHSTVSPTLTINLGIMLKHKYFRSGEQNDFENARSPLSDLQGTSEEKAAFVELVDLHDESFIRSGFELHREESLRLRKKLRDMGSEFVHSFRIDELARDNPDRFSVRQSIEDVEKSIKICRAARQLVPQDNPSYPDWLYWLSFYMSKRFQSTREIPHAEEALQLLRQVLNITDQEHDDYPYYLLQISEVLRNLYHETDDVESIDEAIQFSELALSIISKTHSLRQDALFDRSILLSHRYRSKGALADLNEAISLGEQTLWEGSNDDAPKPWLLLNMAEILHMKYERTDSSFDLGKAIEFAKKANEELQSDDSGKMVCFKLLSKLLLSQSKLSGSYESVEEAVEYAEQALDQALEHFEGNATNECRYIFCYVHAMLEKYAKQIHDRMKDKSPVDEIDEMTEISLMAIESLPDGHPTKSSLLLTLGSLYSCKLSRVANADGSWGQAFEEACIQASRSYERCLTTPGAKPMARIQAVMGLLNIGLAIDGRVTAGMLGILLIQEFQGQIFTLEDKQYWASEVLGLASDTAAAMMTYERTRASKHPEVSHLEMGWLALATLSRGRGMLLSSIKGRREHSIDVEGGNSKLGKTSVNPHVELMEQISHGLKLAITSEVEPHAIQSMEEDKHRVAGFIDDLVNDIWGLAEMDYFLSVHPRSDILEAAKSGPIVVLNLSVKSYEGCDVFIITQSHLEVINFKDVGQEEIRYWALSGEKIWSKKCLAWLWDTITGPIMDALGFTQPPDNDDWPHVTWIPTGVLSKFPLHASGRHERGGHETVMDRVVSSYGTTAQTLVASRLQAPTVSTPAEALLVAMSNTPGHGTLPHATDEVCEIQKIFDRTSVNAAQVRGYKENIKSRLSKCNIFHFAGHGYTDYVDPSKSHLCLEDKSSPLSIAELLDLNLDQGAHFLAYLSACGTGRVREEKFLDESIHLISAFQVLGFRHAIGTLWEVQDETCMEIARLTYEVIRDENMTDQSVSRGLHKATKRVRDEWLAEYARRTLDTRAGKMVSHQEDISNSSLQERGDDAREGRDILPLEDDWGQSSPPPWIAYVHYRV